MVSFIVAFSRDARKVKPNFITTMGVFDDAHPIKLTFEKEEDFGQKQMADLLAPISAHFGGEVIMYRCEPIQEPVGDSLRPAKTRFNFTAVKRVPLSTQWMTKYALATTFEEAKHNQKTQYPSIEAMLLDSVLTKYFAVPVVYAEYSYGYFYDGTKRYKSNTYSIQLFAVHSHNSELYKEAVSPYHSITPEA